MFDKIPVGQDSFLPVCFGAYRNAPELTLTMTYGQVIPTERSGGGISPFQY